MPLQVHAPPAERSSNGSISSMRCMSRLVRSFAQRTLVTANPSSARVSVLGDFSSADLTHLGGDPVAGPLYCFRQ